jgi:hypothetical protein
MILLQKGEDTTFQGCQVVYMRLNYLSIAHF